jgi:hypothetical protein
MIMSILENELILLSVLSHLPPASLLRFERVCTAWRDLIRNNRELKVRSAREEIRLNFSVEIV